MCETLSPVKLRSSECRGESFLTFDQISDQCTKIYLPALCLLAFIPWNSPIPGLHGESSTIPGRLHASAVLPSPGHELILRAQSLPTTTIGKLSHSNHSSKSPHAYGPIRPLVSVSSSRFWAQLKFNHREQRLMLRRTTVCLQLWGAATQNDRRHE